MLGAIDFGGPAAASWTSAVASLSGLSQSNDRDNYLVGRARPRADDQSFVLAANADLHDSSEIATALGFQKGPEWPSDDDLILALYNKWQERCIEFLSGEFAFAIWDPRRSLVFCARDHLGSRSLFYWRNPTRFACSNNSASLLKLPGIPRILNRRKLAGMAVPGGQHFHDEETFHSGILSLPGGSWLRVDRSDVRRKQYWEPGLIPSSAPPRPQEAFGVLRDLLFKSVENHLIRKNSPAVLLSGGLDSAAVASIAAHCLARKNQVLTAFSAVLPVDHRSGYSDERQFIDEFRPWKNIRIEYVTDPKGGPFDGIEDPSCFWPSFLGTSRNHLYEALGRAASQGAMDVILTGNLGELGATADGRGSYLEMFTRLRWTGLVKALLELRRTQGTSPVRALGGELLDLFQGSRQFRPMVLFAPGFRAECEATPIKLGRSANHRTRQIQLLRYQLRKHATGMEHCLGGVPVRYPLFDRKVMEFCFSAPASLKVCDGYPRYLIRGALAGILPEKIRWRLDKKPFSPDYAVRYNAQLGKAQDFAASIGINDPVRSVVDVTGLNRLLEPLPFGQPSWTALIQVPATIRLICFLRQFSEFQR